MEFILPQPYRDIINSICDHDRIYFEQHPEKSSYTRAAITGEFYPQDIPCRFVIVHQLVPGVRLREPIN